jgi:hypothetical protein
MKYAVEMGSDAIIYTANLIKIGLANRKLIGRKTDTQDNMVIT